MIFEQLHIGGDKNLAYLVGDEKTAEVAAVDPGCNPDMLLQHATDRGWTITHILATHSHHDHIAGVGQLREQTQAIYAAYKTVPEVDRPLNDGDRIGIGEVALQVIFCPGHCADTILLLCNGEKLIVGDEIFIGGVGRTHSEQQTRLHYDNLHGILLQLPDHVEIYPGHDYGQKPCSTIGEQKNTNPFLLQPDFESFRHLRQNWKNYCREHNIAWG